MYKPFKIVLPYCGRMVVAVAQIISDASGTGLFVRFPDGNQVRFATYDGDLDYNGWLEEPGGITRLSKTVGPYLDIWITIRQEHIEPLTVRYQGLEYVVVPTGYEPGVIFEVYRDGRIAFAMDEGEDGTWLSSGLPDEALITFIVQELRRKKY